MRYNILFVSVVMLAFISWTRLSSVSATGPSHYSSQSKVVNLKFKVTAKDMNSIEMGLNEGGGQNNMFVVFDLADNFAGGNFSLILKSVSERASLGQGSGRKPDVSKFERDNSGRAIDAYTFSQELVRDDKGNYYIKMQYVGAEMPMIQNLSIAGNFPLPRNIAARFVNNGSVEFLAGNYRLDGRINGFWIPVRVS